MTMSEPKEIQRLREENACHKRPLSQAELEKASWKELSEGNFYAPLAIMMPCGIWSSGATPKDILARALGSLVVPIGVPERVITAVAEPASDLTFTCNCLRTNLHRLRKRAPQVLLALVLYPLPLWHSRCQTMTGEMSDAEVDPARQDSMADLHCAVDPA